MPKGGDAGNRTQVRKTSIIIVYVRSSRSGARALGGDGFRRPPGPPPSAATYGAASRGRRAPSRRGSRLGGYLTGILPTETPSGRLADGEGDHVVVRDHGLLALVRADASAARTQMSSLFSVETFHPRCGTRSPWRTARASVYRVADAPASVQSHVCFDAFESLPLSLGLVEPHTPRRIDVGP